MLRYVLALLTLAPISAYGLTASAQRGTSLLGDWAARLDIDGRPRVLWLKVSETPGNELVASAWINPALDGTVLTTFSNIKIVSQESSWTMATGSDTNLLRLEVRKGEGAFVAKYQVRTSTGTTQFWRVPADPTANRPLEGTYVTAAGENISIRTGTYGGNKVLNYLEEKTGRSGNLSEIAQHSFAAGPSSALPAPAAQRFTFEGNPVDRLTLRSGGKTAIARKSPTYVREDIQIPVEGAVLGCQILKPVGAGKHPGIVLVPGSGAVDRFAGYYILAELFAQHGIASLICDKRGTGTSTGDWRYQSFDQQAQDVVAGMQRLRSRSEVDASRVGIWAFSQGTYPGPIAAVTGDASFLILVAGFGHSLRDTVMTGNIERMKRSGTANAEIERYQDYFGRWQQAVLANDFSAYESVYKQYSGAAWLPNNAQSENLFKTSWQNARARLMWPYKPGPTLRQLKIPVLAFWGSEDDEAIPRIEQPTFEQLLRDAGNPDYSLRVIAGAEHGMQINGAGIHATGYAPEYISGMLEWLRARVLKPVPAPG